ncbi:hypothetical protein TGAMA5MH_06749 [Trichoderma gamsii]|uniref:RING-type domain-containing protein n=1 Tax=Trichoderma gamsii TaxID=398673 RepID=A0A2K0T7C2_9HYPO|nr:hypothetical protein TGAMA5MH_06749 [Trichoderma gamsii]
MDNPNDRTLHPGRPYHPEPLNGPPTPSWVPPEQIHPSGPQSQAYLGQNHAPRPRAHHSLGRPSTTLDPYQMGFSGGPLLPNPISQSSTLPHPNGGLYMSHQGQWASHPMQSPIPPNYGGMMNMPGGLRYELMPGQPAVGSGYSSQPPESNMGMGMHAGTGLDGTIPALPYYVGPPPMYQAGPAGPVGLDPQPAGSATYNRRLASRVARTQSFYSPSSPPVYHDFLGPPPHRRSTYSSRARRSSLNTRPVAPGLNRDTEEDGGHNSNEHRPGVPDHQTGQEPAAAADNSPTRPLSKTSSTDMLLHYSLSIKVEDLPEQDRECSICYNKYGIELPEGIREAPRRLPKCKHVFGDYCLKTWLNQSASCPYCRDKLVLRFEHGLDSRRAQAYMTLMRARARVSVPPEPPGPPGTTTSLERDLGFMPPVIHDEEEVVEAQFVTILEQQLHRSRETDLSAVDGENTPSDSSSAPASPIRASLRDVSRFSQWSSRTTLQRANRRQRGSRSSLPPLQPPPQSDGPSQPSATIPGADAREGESSQSPEDAGRGPAETSMAPSTAQSRNRPW